LTRLIELHPLLSFLSLGKLGRYRGPVEFRALLPT